MLLLSKFRISGHSMEPVLRENDLILVSKIPYLFKKPKLNDIVAVKLNKKILIKRIFNIKKEEYFVIGDNKKDSRDSNKFGKIARKQIIGKVIHKL